MRALRDYAIRAGLRVFPQIDRQQRPPTLRQQCLCTRAGTEYWQLIGDGATSETEIAVIPGSAVGSPLGLASPRV